MGCLMVATEQQCFWDVAGCLDLYGKDDTVVVSVLAGMDSWMQSLFGVGERFEVAIRLANVLLSFLACEYACDR